VSATLASDADGDTLSFTFLSGPDHGSLSCEGNDCTYTPAADYSGSDGFTFRAEDGNGGSDEGTVTIEVRPVNDAPVAEDVQAVTEEDTPVDVALAASDVDDTVLEYSVVDGPDHGAVTCDGALCHYTPAADFHGGDAFTYRVTDPHGASDDATVAISIEEVLLPTAIEVSAVVDTMGLPPRVNVQYEARLTRADTGDPLAGRTITFLVSGQVACTAETDADGVASCERSVEGSLAVLLNDGYDAVFAGDEDQAPASGHGPIVR
jgi:hypothetical protein